MKKRNFLFLVMSIIVCIGPVLKAQDRFILTQTDLPDWVLMNTENWFWPINDSVTKDVIKQKWLSSDSVTWFLVEYCEFENEEKALAGVSYFSNSFSAPSEYGSQNGTFFGNTSWYNWEWTAGFLQWWNIGIKILQFDTFSFEDHTNFQIIVNKICDRIQDSIDQQYRDKDSVLLKDQIPLEEYNKVIENSRDSLIKYGFTESQNDNPKWIVSLDSLVMARRTVWNGINSTFAISICKFSSSAAALEAMQYSSEVLRVPYCNLSDSQQIEELIASRYWTTEFCLFGLTGNYVVLFYYYDSSSLDFELFRKILGGIITSETNINESLSTDFLVYPNPAADYILIEFAGRISGRCQLSLLSIDGKTLLCKDIVPVGTVRLDVSKIERGVYILNLLTGNKKAGTIVKIE